VEPSTPVWVAPAQMTLESLDACERAAIAAAGAEGVHLVVDLSSAVFVSSGALGMLVRLSMRFHDRGGGLALAAAPLPIARLLRTVGLERVLPAFPTVAAAAGHLAVRPARV
jgi:anti-anti-sigma factor